MPVEVVDIILKDPTVVGGIRTDGLHSQIAMPVVDNIRRVIDVSHARCRRATEI